MSAVPSLTRFGPGSPVTAIQPAQLNTFVQGGNAFFKDLRGFAGDPGQLVFASGSTAVNDGGQGVFQLVQLANDVLPPTDDNFSVLQCSPSVWPRCYWQRITLSTAFGNAGLEYVIDDGPSVLNTGVRGAKQCPFSCTITGVTLLADQSGSAVVDIWKTAYAGYPGTSANSITASDKPTLSTSQKYTDATLTGWTTTINAGDVLMFDLVSAVTITRLTIMLTVLKTG